MSVLFNRTPANAPQSDRLVTPTDLNTWKAGAGGSALIESGSGDQGGGSLHLNPAKVRTHMNAPYQPDLGIHAYFHVVPMPKGLSKMALAPSGSTQMAAATELNAYMGELTDPFECHLIPGGAPGVDHFESVHALPSTASLENLHSNLRMHDLCLQCNFTHPNDRFQSSTLKLTANDLSNVIDHTMGGAGGDKFIQAVIPATPHTALFHIRTDDLGQHFFYGLNITQKKTFFH